ncbi:glutathione S-transferase family protein [Salmonella enterica subsp. enterica serovar Napoli]|uniref:Glutathione S-transferase GstB n=1 Tax=Salmonella enterica subsp. enterica serovar Napoli TaxID=1151001 RepID=A0A5J2K874_SALET|nr:glutathione S-transferase family protein [Salmonella enterica]EBY1535291.1 glutathione S-transferase family protein [Salmonella enterica subsp. enterica serovar Mgulani]ECB1139875.1 glutathione S-transferase family protein [Salmonella enterica subsp. enterica serovar Napoli]ECE6322658.1 glutathione S-transferase family protein [Salmonella enterica subsp. enterica]ECB3223052.1 glutathione S-transferase family protein [Salmonella enterica subsp. enterica serovar Napoli]
MITLWGRNNSTNVKKVLWTLEELELPYDQILAGGKFGVNQDADYLAMNPNGLVPLLKDDETDLLLWESNAIVRYLAAQYGQNRLWVDNPARRAEGEKWMDWANQTLSPAHRVILMGLVRTPPEKRDQAAIEAGIEKCDSLFALLDDALAHQPWFSGDNFGTGDIAIAPFVYNLLNVGLKWTPRPNLERWYQQLTERPAFRKVVMISVT